MVEINKSKMNRRINHSGSIIKPLLISILILLLIIISYTWIPKFIAMSYPESSNLAKLKLNMQILQIAVDSFATLTEGHYPHDIDITVYDVANELGLKYNSSISVVGAGNRDTVSTFQIGSFGPSLLPKNFTNPYDKSRPVLIVSTADPPVWDKNYIGVVYYVPLEVEDNIAKSYKIYGAGKDDLLSLVLSSKSNKKDDN